LRLCDADRYIVPAVMVNVTEQKLSFGLSALRGKAVPANGLNRVLLARISHMVYHPEMIGRVGMALCDGAVIPLCRFVRGFWHACADMQHHADTPLRFSVAGLRQGQQLAIRGFVVSASLSGDACRKIGPGRRRNTSEQADECEDKNARLHGGRLP